MDYLGDNLHTKPPTLWPFSLALILVALTCTVFNVVYGQEIINMGRRLHDWDVLREREHNQLEQQEDESDDQEDEEDEEEDFEEEEEGGSEDGAD
ncbi:putative F-box protein At1g47300 [Drosophila madeirensis]|uniref:F-box protein At1g47300 n=1 Tax=Drosophila madeirensis TaxID=30013 RepID=A0AAU9FYA2_DROMD